MAEPAYANDLVVAAGQVLGFPVRSLAPVRGGGNSRVYRIRCDAGEFALKVYPQPTGERNRLVVEEAALRFFEQQGVAQVPRLCGVDWARSLAIMEWIEGRKPEPPTQHDIEAALGFQEIVAALRNAKGAETLPPAAEACLSGAEILRQIRLRLAELADPASSRPELSRFLEKALTPAVADIGAWAEAEYRARDLDFAAELRPERRSLVAADFGLHNALRQDSGRLVFLDFEYFGWDDPAKLVADFLLHPGMRLDTKQKCRFLAGMAKIHGEDLSFLPRLRLLYSLFGLRWCAILLNEFRPEHWARRVAAGEQGDRREAEERQLARAEDMLRYTVRSQAEFPYG